MKTPAPTTQRSSTPAPFFPPNASGYLGPATVLEVDARRVRLECPDAVPWATLALAHHYRPVVGDLVLAVSNGSEWYVIGLLAGSGTTEFTAPGDLTFHAPKGRIDFVAKDAVSLHASLLEFTAETLEVSARTITERFTDAARWVAGLLRLHTGRMDTKVEGHYDLQADEISQSASGDVTIDGKTINLN